MPATSWIAFASWCGEHPRPAPVAAEQQPARCGSGGEGTGEQRAQVFIGGVGVADVELHGLTGADQVAEGEGSALTVGSDHVRDQEVATVETLLVLTHRQADMNPPLDQLLVGGFGIAVQRVELFDSRDQAPAWSRLSWKRCFASPHKTSASMSGLDSVGKCRIVCEREHSGTRAKQSFGDRRSQAGAWDRGKTLQDLGYPIDQLPRCAPG